MEELKKEEIKTLKTLCEFLFDDMYQYWATYERFELCFKCRLENSRKASQKGEVKRRRTCVQKCGRQCGTGI